MLKSALSAALIGRLARPAPLLLLLLLPLLLLLLLVPLGPADEWSVVAARRRRFAANTDTMTPIPLLLLLPLPPVALLPVLLPPDASGAELVALELLLLLL